MFSLEEVRNAPVNKGPPKQSVHRKVLNNSDPWTGGKVSNAYV